MIAFIAITIQNGLALGLALLFNGKHRMANFARSAFFLPSTLSYNLNVDMKEIKKIVKVIVGIAEQTNLLSLNAAIEAARAGTAGSK